MERAYYSSKINKFIVEEFDSIFGKITRNDKYPSEKPQKDAWKEQIDILKKELVHFTTGHILFEYTIPRIGRRVDCIILYNGIIFLLEFKVGENKYPKNAIRQVVDYALDLSCFHEGSYNKFLVPMLISTEARGKHEDILLIKDKILEPICCNKDNIGSYILKVLEKFNDKSFDFDSWINSVYKPTPTIIEAAQTLYKNHKVEDISRNDAAAKNLNQTTEEINRIIDYSKENSRKSICFITGVPGAGKTLAGLNIAIERQKIDEKEHAVFLSGNAPLVAVLQEALARDDFSQREVRKSDAKRKAETFIQILHKFRDETILSDKPLNEKVIIFDEAQRTWDHLTLANFMKRKKDIPDFNMSEPESLINVMNRHKDWATIVCLIGGGQEINNGESEGLLGWFEALRKEEYKNWDVYVSDEIHDTEYSKGIPVEKMTKGLNCTHICDLHLSVSLRSFRSENVAAFVKALLDVKQEEAKNLLEEISEKYPIYMTRDFDVAKNWVRDKAKGSQRYGITASSGAKRLRKYGVWV